jgi:tetratricopeptide (TPR) repeat protein
MTPEDQSKGRHYLESAVALEPNHAAAWVELVNTYYSRAIQAAASPLVELPTALEAARRAVAADESLAEAHGAWGFIRGSFEYDWTAAVASLRKGIALNPDSSKVHFWYAVLLLFIESIDEALIEFEKAHETDPLSALINMCLASVYNQAGLYDRAIERSHQALEIVPNFFMAYASLGEAYSGLSRHAEAIEWLEKARPQLPGDFWPTGSLGKAYVRAGRVAEAERLLAELESKRREGRYVSAETIAVIAAALGNHDRAFEWLDTAVTERDPQLMWQLKTDPVLAPLRTDPRYNALLRRNEPDYVGRGAKEHTPFGWPASAIGEGFFGSRKWTYSGRE